MEDKQFNETQQRRQWCFTWNHPFWEEDIAEIVDIQNTDLPLRLDYLNLSIVKAPENIDYFEFKHLKQELSEKEKQIVQIEENGEKVEREVIIEKKITAVIERPYFKDVDSAYNYFSNLESMRFFVFQVEKGGNCETTHLQGFFLFKGGKRFRTVKSFIPVAHFEECKSGVVENIEYCSKADTRVEGPFKWGSFDEDRGKKTIDSFYEFLDAGASDMELRNLFPKMFLKEFQKLPKLRMMKKSEVFKVQDRDIEVTYVYGPSGSGKTTYVADLLRGKECFYVDTFDLSAFTGYAGEDILVIDEFKGAGQFNIQVMNRLLDCRPYKLRGLNFLEYACFTKVYIISNFSYKDLYKNEQAENISQYNGFVRRLNKIIRIDGFNQFKIERETIWEDIPVEELKVNGRKKRAKQVIEYDKFGVGKIIFDINGRVVAQNEIKEIPVETNKEIPWED